MNKVYGIAGPTASGKTALSINIAKLINAEIISVDSSLVYKDMNIGSAKPSLEEMQGIKHHMIDLISPTESFSVSDFLTLSNKIKQDVFARGKNVLFVGGTMLYFKALIEGITDLPESDEAIRNILYRECKKFGLEYLYNRLEDLDSESALRININDQQRIFRALEVCLISNQKYSELVSEPKQGALEEELRLVSIVPDDRSLLHSNIEKRFYQMLDAGFVEEVVNIKNKYQIDENTSSMRAVGYRQALEYLNKHISYDDFINKGIIATRQLAKRQLTWLRNWNHSIKHINMESANKENQTLKYFENHIVEK